MQMPTAQPEQKKKLSDPEWVELSQSTMRRVKLFGNMERIDDKDNDFLVYSLITEGNQINDPLAR